MGRLEQARRDQTLLAEVGVIAPFGQGRFSHIQLPPPLPPLPPDPPSAPPRPPRTPAPQAHDWWAGAIPEAAALHSDSFPYLAS